MVLEQIHSPADMKTLNRGDLHQLVDEARTALLEKISQHGGHNGPNLGMVEMTVALHYVFDSPVDKIIYDVSHQSYIHKMLTGRSQAFTDPNHYDDVSGYTNPEESEHDLFTIGHTSTSLSLASGVAKARDLKGEIANVIAVIGDGSLSGGMAFEGLNQIANQKTNHIVIVIDNDQSIAPNPTGGIYTALRNLRESDGQANDNIFKALGYDYHYLDNGNDLDALVALFQKVKDSKHAVLLHIHTIKGKGVPVAEKNREAFHAGGPFNPKTGQYKTRGNSAVTYANMTTDYILAKMEKNPEVAVISAGVPMMILSPEQRVRAGKQFIDVGIAEQQAVTMATGMAKNNAKPVWAVFSTFLQRTYDQLSHDMALNNQAGTILVYGASINGMNDESHLGIFDIPFLSHIPNFVYLAPTNKEEYLAMLDWAIDQKEQPVAIRVPVGQVKESGVPDTTDYSILNKNQVTQKGRQVAIFGLGNFFKLAQEVAQELKNKHDVVATVINPRFITGLDTALLDSLSDKHNLVVTLEDGILEGGYGQTIASYLGNSSLKVQNYGLNKEFYDRYDASQVLTDLGLTVENIVGSILENLK